MRNSSARSQDIRVRYTVTDATGKRTAGTELRTQIVAGGESDVVGKLMLNSPRLWYGLNDPYLYTMAVDVYSGEELVDRVTEKFGIRFFSVDADKGFFLNGEPYKLRGVNRHQDRENKGWAIGLEEHREDFALIREIGANAVRLAHYQHAKEFYALCDSAGVAVWAELALVDFVNASPAFLENCRTQLTELIKQSFNHPSIFCWALFNELIPSGKESLYEAIVARLNGLSSELDPTRFTSCASRSAFDGATGVNRITDLLAFNVYRGWYEPDPADFAAFIDDMHRRYPELLLGIGEYGAGAGIHTHEHPARLHDTRGRWHPEEWQAVVHEVVWKAIAEREFLWGSFVWNMFDFASDTRSEGEMEGINDKGLVTYDRRTRKDSFYWYMANWNPGPMVHITEKRFTPRPAGRVTVKVYSNCESVELVVDGKSLGAKQSLDRRFLWDNVVLSEGTQMLTAHAFEGGKTISDTCAWEVEGR
jgi:beta-galactosidase